MLGLLGVFALSAIAAPAASASPKWWVAEKLFEGKAALAEETSVTKPLKVEASGLTLECKKVKVKSGLIESPSSRSEKAEVFEECQAGGSACKTGTTETKPLKATLEGSTGAIKLKFEPQTGKEIAKFEITGASCTIKGTYTLTGTMICNYNGVETESIEHPLEFTPTSGSEVEVNSKSAKFSGTDEVLLASGEKWSAR
jgi:hypothetical protein